MPARLAMRLLAALDRRLLWRVAHAGNKVFLTFDDGPCPGITPWVLDTLAVHGAKATFFCLGQQAEQHPELMQRIRADGHSIGHHTWDHADGWRTAKRPYQRSVLRAARSTGSMLFRPPYGHLPPGQLRSIGRRYRVVMWDVMGYDFKPGRRGGECARHVLRHARPGSIIVLHDNPKSAACLKEALVPILQGFRCKGYACAALGPIMIR
ncbi:MAG: polysaccharide deacetylase family protein [Flavobacteriales bacterium]|nr:polysaccharide deacetylase family protein [Flavobacteriales bacterium]MBP9079742.1 polysaccharide deacetylase family protein [Flavobacteriales bacterium]